MQRDFRVFTTHMMIVLISYDLFMTLFRLSSYVARSALSFMLAIR